MIRARQVCIAFLFAAAFSAPALAQEEAHYEGYATGLNSAANGTWVSARGLVTALYLPLSSDFVANEYTWVITGLIPTNTTFQDSVYTTVYQPSNDATFAIWEDPCQDARPAFYLCPSGILVADSRYSNSCSPAGTPYLRGHFTYFMTALNIRSIASGQGTFTATLNWDSGTHLTQLSPGHRGGWHFGGSTTSVDACLPAGYQQALTGRIFQATTSISPSTWGRLKKLYR